MLIFPALIAFPPGATAAGLALHMHVVPTPHDGRLAVDSTIVAGQPVRQFEFVLNSGLAPSTDSGTLTELRRSGDGLRTAWRVTLQTPGDTLKLQYHGKPVFSRARRLGDMPQGVISADAIYLDGASAWYPRFERDFDRIELQVSLPEDFESVSIGGRQAGADGSVTWTADLPHDDLYLIAGRYTRHARRHGEVELSVWLLEDDPALAARYLDLMGGYIDQYSRLIGAYPYPKFAVIENHWQTGFGMPSFTLLGSRVMRLPFIPYTSLPHEILHNWWGNGVWVDYAAGNWSEGLTAYLADHWMQERQGKGAEYRLQALQRYSNFAAGGDDMALLDFVSRHSDATQSVGYGKSLMLFHMLRQALGDAEFVAGLQRLWQEQRFRRVGFAEVVATLAAARPGLAESMQPWLTRTGAPRIRLADAAVRRDGPDWELRLRVEQAQDRPFSFDLPILITLEGESPARRESARVDAASVELVYRLPARPLRVDLDPEYDLLRELDPTEQPPALNRLFGGAGTWLVVPRAAPPAMRAAWAELAAAWQRRYPGLRLVEDDAADRLPANADRLLLGWDNALLAGARTALARPEQVLEERALQLDGRRFGADRFSLVLVDTDAAGVTTGFIGAPDPDAVAALARKLPHYGSYGRLLFDPAGEAVVRDRLSSAHSRLTRQFGEQAVALQPPPRPVLGSD
jgi:hypothetical protein